ncbi:MAG TPA: hypothetical protein VGM88_11635 [Kofleriaceae bacterium]|jgi:hypothetical protein
MPARTILIAGPLCIAVGVGAGALLFRSHGSSADEQVAAHTKQWCAGLGTLLRHDAEVINKRCEADTRQCLAPLGRPPHEAPDPKAGAAIESVQTRDDAGVILFCAPSAVLSCDDSDVLCFARLASLAADALGARAKSGSGDADHGAD